MDVNKRRAALISCFLIHACCFVALYVISFEAVGWHFKSGSDRAIFSWNVSSVSEVSSGRFMHTRVLGTVGNVQHNSDTTTDLVTPEMDTLTVNKFLICQRPTGRLGNQMFDFASAVGIAHALNYKFIMRSPHPLLEYFELNQTLAPRIKNVKKISIFEWRQNTWDKTYLSHNLTLDRCWRAWEYFDSVSDGIRKSFTIKPEYLNVAKTFLKSHSRNNKTLIGVHVRRGDFLTERSKIKGRVVVDKNYLRKAMYFFRTQHKDALFVIVSNDIKWCKDNMQGNDVVFSIFTEPIHDMAILSLCNHTVMSTGTFGWWGAWLAGGTVVYCSDYPRPGSIVANNTLFRDNFYPPSWIGMSNGI